MSELTLFLVPNDTNINNLDMTKVIEVDYDTYKNMEYIMDLVRDTFGEDVSKEQRFIPLSNIDSGNLKIVVEWLKMYNGNLPDADSLENTDISQTDLNFFQNFNLEDLRVLLLGVNYLGINYLIEFLCKMIGERIRGKTAEEMYTLLGLTRPFTAEEIEVAKQSEAWVFE